MEMGSDPTPGDPDRIERLGNELDEFAEDVFTALGKVRSMGEEGALASFVGESAEAYRDRFDKLPPDLNKLHTSYDLAAQALLTYAPKLREAQTDADRALNRAIEAREELSTAQSWLERATSALEDATEAAEPPDEGEVAAEVRRALTDAETDQGNAESAVTDARGKLDLAIALAAQAKELREEAAQRCKADLEEASEAGIPNRKWWQKAADWVVDNWDTIVAVAKVVVAVVGIIVMIIGGPLAWLVLAAALIVLADTLIDYANGDATLWDVGFAALDCIPGFKGMTTAAGLLTTARNGLRRTADEVLQSGGEIRRVRNDIDFETEWADAAYDQIRKADDVGAVATTAQRHGFTPDQVRQIKKHLFEDEHLLDSYGEARVGKFDSNPRIAEAWVRLRNGNPHSSDIDLLRHELYESNHMRETGSNSYKEAHQATLDAGHTWDPEAASRDGFGRRR
ncbi:hypothetical protein LZF96_19740 [Streptomyces sp. ST2-7A]|nr:hypothetical protein [Streptomyces sp. ST2-7A]